MPNINEFLNQPSEIADKNLEVIKGSKPCSKCDKDTEQYYWDPTGMVISWECPDGHKNSHVVG